MLQNMAKKARKRAFYIKTSLRIFDVNEIEIENVLLVVSSAFNRGWFWLL